MYYSRLRENTKIEEQHARLLSDNFADHRDGDINAITDRFKGYKSAIENGKITPQPIVLSKKEQEIMANTVFDDWMKNKFEHYAQASFSRTRYYLKDAPYQAISPDRAKHEEVMKKMFTIDGYDFWKYIAKREAEIFARITPDMEKE